MSTPGNVVSATPGIVVSALRSTPIKGLRIATRQHVMLERGGVRGDRRFYLVDERGRMVNGKHIGALNSVLADLDDDERLLTLAFPSGEVLGGPIELGPELQTSFFSRTRAARVLLGPFSAALSDHATGAAAGRAGRRLLGHRSRRGRSGDGHLERLAGLAGPGGRRARA
jgi:hypothetical protein